MVRRMPSAAAASTQSAPSSLSSSLPILSSEAALAVAVQELTPACPIGEAQLPALADDAQLAHAADQAEEHKIACSSRSGMWHLVAIGPPLFSMLDWRSRCGCNFGHSSRARMAAKADLPSNPLLICQKCMPFEHAQSKEAAAVALSPQTCSNPSGAAPRDPQRIDKNAYQGGEDRLRPPPLRDGNRHRQAMSGRI